MTFGRVIKSFKITVDITFYFVFVLGGRRRKGGGTKIFSSIVQRCTMFDRRHFARERERGGVYHVSDSLQNSRSLLHISGGQRQK